jgi:urea transporter
MGRTKMIYKRTFNSIFFLFFGAIIGLLFFFLVWKATDNILTAFGVMAITLAFWIGTLTVIFRGKLPF